MIHRGTIKEFKGGWVSGLASLVIEDENGDTTIVSGDSGPIGRALGAMFDAIGEGHTITHEKIVGQEVYYILDDMGLGLLAGIESVENATEELHEAYENQQEEG